MLRIVADLGNSRFKWGRLDPAGRLGSSIALPTDDPAAWAEAWARWNPGESLESEWAIATVNPPAAEQLADFLKERRTAGILWYRSAAQVPIPHLLEHAETTGADRALAVAGALRLIGPGLPFLVVSCGSAVTVERASADGVWQGGAIAPGLRLSARALNAFTAQLPLVSLEHAPPAWGRSTVPALEAGLFWGAAGAIRELLTRQSDDLPSAPRVVWTGGDASILAPAVAWEGAAIVPDLVLIGLIGVAFGNPDE